MAQSADETAKSVVPVTDNELPEPFKFSLSIVSPSPTVPTPFMLHELLVTNTVQDLKAKIRDALPDKPTDETQRLIYHGRLLVRETETMENIFGRQVVSAMKFKCC